MESMASVLSAPVAVCGSSYGFGRHRLSLFVTSLVNFGRLGLPVAAVSEQRRRSELVAFAENGDNLVPRASVYTVGDFMMKKDELHVVKVSTTVEDALEALVEKRITGFPVIDDDWKLVGVVSDYDLLALDSISGATPTDSSSLFPDVDSSWKTFNEIQKLLSKTNGRTVGDVMTSDPLVVRETTNLEDAARLLLETKYRQLPVVNAKGKLGLNPMQMMSWLTTTVLVVKQASFFFEPGRVTPTLFQSSASL